MSEFSCPVVRLGLIVKHPQADTLSITEVQGCPVVIRTADFREGDLAVYIPLEAAVKQGVYQPLDFLPFKSNGIHRVRAAKLRGTFSMGLLVKTPAQALVPDGPDALVAPQEGDDLSAFLGVTKYEEPEDKPLAFDTEACPPGLVMPYYDLEAFRKYKHLYLPQEYVAVTEKLHGENGKFVHWGGKLCVSSHNNWKKAPLEGQRPNQWWQAAAEADLEARLQHPDVKDKLGFYGEVYGRVQDLKYGVPPGGVRVAMFDVLDLRTQTFLDYPEFLAVCGALGLETAPCLFTGQLDEARVFALAEGPTTLMDGDPRAHVREGVVVRPLKERQHPHRGRICFKLHGTGYLLRRGGTERH
jgi:RNA ligase (TIGR02306 family)